MASVLDCIWLYVENKYRIVMKMNSVTFLMLFGITIVFVPLRTANILRMFQEEPPVARYRYSPQFLQHSEAGKKLFIYLFVVHVVSIIF